MLKKTLLFIIFIQLLSVIMLKSQIEYDLILERSEDCKSFSLMMMEDDFVLTSLYYQDTTELVIINPRGDVVATHAFYPQTDTTYIVHYTSHSNRSGYYIGIGEQNIGGLIDGIHNIWIFECDENLNIQWERIISGYPFPPLSMSFQYANNAHYFLVSSYPEYHLTSIYKMDKKCEQILHAVEINNRSLATTCFMRQIPESSDFLVNFGLDDKYLYIFDEDLNEISELKYDLIDLTYPIDGEFINEKEFISAGIYIEGEEYTNNALFGLKKTDITRDINVNQLEVFGYEWLDMYNPYLGCRTGERKTLAMHDDYFYYGGVGREDVFTNYGYDDNALVLYAFNHNLDSLWSMTVADDAYYKLWSIAPTDDGGCVMAAWRSDWRQGKNKWDTYIVKIAKPQFNNIAPLPKNEVVVYPNPGGDRLSIKTDAEQFTFQLFDMQGRLLLERENEKEIAANELPSGFYLYKIIDRQGKMSTGKWIKK